MQVDLIIIGGGSAGLSAAIAAYEEGLRDILIIERNKELGGILNQCIHNGFGLHYFKEELTGPEYAQRLIDKVLEYNISYRLDTMVLDLNKDRQVTLLSESGVEEIQAKAVILAMGCRERPRGAINIPGSRPAGIFSAGNAQEMVNIHGLKVGNTAVILGSGDIGLIMARRLTFEGAKVQRVVELMPYSSGLKRNIVQCLDDFNIPIKYSSTITNIVGKERLEGVYIAQVDTNFEPILSTEEFIPCDTLLLSVGLIPENELSQKAGVTMSPITGGAIVDSNMQTNIEGIFSCGNVLHVHDLVDQVTFEAFEAAKGVYKYLNGKLTTKDSIKVIPKKGVRYTVPDTIGVDKDARIKLRCDNVYTNGTINVYYNGNKIKSEKKRIITPGEMEIVKIGKDILNSDGYKDKTIEIEIV